MMKEKLFDLEERLVRFAGEVIIFCNTLPKTPTGLYYADQIMRSSGSAALNYGEAQGTNTSKDFIYKMSLVLKELKETRVSHKILTYVNMGDQTKREWLLKEVNELVPISAKIIQNRKNRK